MDLAGLVLEFKHSRPPPHYPHNFTLRPPENPLLHIIQHLLILHFLEVQAQRVR